MNVSYHKHILNECIGWNLQKIKIQLQLPLANPILSM